MTCYFSRHNQKMSNSCKESINTQRTMSKQNKIDMYVENVDRFADDIDAVSMCCLVKIILEDLSEQEWEDKTSAMHRSNDKENNRKTMIKSIEKMSIVEHS
jgi:hypothetical protein